MANVGAAKRSAAMKACIKLYENNELTDHLVPLSTKKVLEDLEESYFSHWSNFTKGKYIDIFVFTSHSSSFFFT